jgi:amino-acid N-acetyltransferase
MSELNEIVSLLAENDLPVSDISPSHPPRFFGVRVDATLAAVVGLDLFGSVGLLRSLAVSPAYRGRGMARELVVFVERFAASHGVETLFLLTTTAADFFVKLGYLTASRPNAPAVIQATPQFSDLCPSSSVFLSKRVAGLTDHPAGLRETPRSPINL